MSNEPLNIICVGDSVMWGQGLAEPEKFTTIACREIGIRLNRPVNKTNFARSGSQIDVTSKLQKDTFLNTYPHLFGSANEKHNFITVNDQTAATRLPFELPCTFPTVLWQIEHLSSEFRKEIDILFLNGGANDFDFPYYLDPTHHRDDFLQYFEPLFEEYFCGRVSNLIRKAREKFPKALIIYTGYYSPFAFGISDGELKDFFYEEERTSSAKRFINEYLWNKTDVTELVAEAQIRSQHGLTRSLHWIRKAISGITANQALGDPGVIFANPMFLEENTVFAKDTFVFNQPFDANDPMHILRKNACPRIEHVDDFELLYLYVKDSNPHPIVIDKALSAIKRLRESLNGPQVLIEILNKPNNDWDDSDRKTVQSEIESELDRIKAALRASFLHPNEKGAKQYADVIVERFEKYHHHIHVKSHLPKENLGQLPKKISIKKWHGSS